MQGLCTCDVSIQATRLLNTVISHRHAGTMYLCCKYTKQHIYVTVSGLEWTSYLKQNDLVDLLVSQVKLKLTVEQLAATPVTCTCKPQSKSEQLEMGHAKPMVKCLAVTQRSHICVHTDVNTPHTAPPPSPPKKQSQTHTNRNMST